MMTGNSEFLGTSPSDCSTTCADWVLPSFLLVQGTAGWYSTPFTVTFHRNLRLFVGPLSTQANDGTDQCRFWHNSINPEMGFLPCKSRAIETCGLRRFDGISSIATKPRRSALMSKTNGSWVPHLSLPNPSPGFQPIFCSKRIPTPLCRGFAWCNWSYITLQLISLHRN